MKLYYIVTDSLLAIRRTTMRKQRKRLLAKAYKCKYKWSNRNNMWLIGTISGSYTASSYGRLTDEEFLERLKWYKEENF
jgi:hypothetical protein